MKLTFILWDNSIMKDELETLIFNSIDDIYKLNSSNIGNAALDPVSNFPNGWGLSIPT